MNEKKKIPGFSIGVREGAAIRMVKLMRPICPNSNKKPDELLPGEFNCQRDTDNAVGWWDLCESRGHNPYFTVHERPVPTPIIEVDEVTGEKAIVGEKKVLVEETWPNIAQVALSERINSGRGVQNAINRKGFKMLSDFGYEEVCQFRNCQKPVGVKTVYGDYCSEEHARLIAADVEGVTLEVQGNPHHERSARKRKRQLRETELYGNA